MQDHSVSENGTSESGNNTEEKEKNMTLNECKISAINVGTPENPLKAEAFHLLHQIFGSGDEALINYTLIQLRLLAGKDTEKETDIPTSQMLTDSEHPADNLICLKSMTDFMRASAIGIACSDGTLSRSEWDGMVYMLGIIGNDLEMIADKL